VRWSFAAHLPPYGLRIGSGKAPVPVLRLQSLQNRLPLDLAFAVGWRLVGGHRCLLQGWPSLRLRLLLGFLRRRLGPYNEAKLSASTASNAYDFRPLPGKLYVIGDCYMTHIAIYPPFKMRAACVYYQMWVTCPVCPVICTAERVCVALQISRLQSRDLWRGFQ
jgi:hypothetical protein